jgi:aminoacylase
VHTRWTEAESAAAADEMLTSMMNHDEGIDCTAKLIWRRIVRPQLALISALQHTLCCHEEFTLGDVTTVNLTILKGGQQFNVVPPEAEAGFDIRIAPTVDLDAFRRRLDDWCNEPGVSYEFVQQLTDNRITPIDDSNPWWTTLKATTDRLGLHIKPEIFPAATDSRFLRQIDVPAFGISFINNTPILLHDHNEWLSQDVFLQAIPIYEELIAALASLSADVRK